MVFIPDAPTVHGRRIAAIVLFGVLCRVAQYAANPSLWHDEALVALNVMDRSAPALLGKLDYAQAAPPVFLWIERTLWKLTHNPDLALRLPSAVCGILATALFAVLCIRTLPPWPALVAVAIFALSDKLIWHSAEVKPYSGDALAAVILLLLAQRIERRPSAWFRFACVAAVLAWLSYPTVFVFGGISLALFQESLRNRRWAIAWIVGNLVVVGSFAVLDGLAIRPQHVDYLAAYWAREFPDLARPWNLPLWAVKQIYRFANYPYRDLGAAVLALAIPGAIASLRDRATLLGRAVLYMLGLAIVAAIARQYPFTGDRITVYLLPGLLLLCGLGIKQLLDWLPARAGAVAFLPALVLVGRGVVEASYRLVVPRSRSEIREVAAYVRTHRQPGEALYLVHESDEESANFTGTLGIELLCYWHNPPAPWHSGLPANLSAIREQRFWVVSSALPKHATLRISPLLNALRSIATERECHVAPHGGGCAVLFDRGSTDAKQP